MNENAKLWVETLHGDEYTQTTRTLHREDDGFCCLGVACNLYHNVTGKGEWVPLADYTKENGVPFDSSDHTPLDAMVFVVDDPPEGRKGANVGVLPTPVRDWLGLQSHAGNSMKRTLAVMNDDGETFERIATFVESEPAGLFVAG